MPKKQLSPEQGDLSSFRGEAPRRVLLPVMPSNNLKSYPKHKNGGQAHYLPIGDVLTTKYSTDAHTAAYSYPRVARRLGTDEALSLDGGIPMVVFFADVDGPDHKCSEVWWEEEKTKIRRLLEECPLFVYRTRGGYRLVGVLPEPIVLKSRTDTEAWRQTYLTWLVVLERKSGIIADSGCADWTHLFRLPHATRAWR